MEQPTLNDQEPIGQVRSEAGATTDDGVVETIVEAVLEVGVVFVESIISD